METQDCINIDDKFEKKSQNNFDDPYAEDVAALSAALAKKEKALKEANRKIAELETFKSGFTRLYSDNESLKKQVEAYKAIVTAQTTLIQLK